MSALGGDGESAVLSFGPDQLFWNGEEVSVPPSAPAVKLVALLFHLGLAALRLNFPQASNGLPDLAGRIATLHEPPGESDRAYLLAEAHSLSGVELVPLDLSGVQLVSPEAPDASGRLATGVGASWHGAWPATVPFPCPGGSARAS